MKDYEQVFQGDIWIMKLPDSMKIAFESELPRMHGKIILQEGEATGHHHYVDNDVLDRPASFKDDDGDTGFSVEEFFSKTKEPNASFWNAQKVAEQLVKDDVLTRADLAVGLLKIDGGPMKVYHQEHNSIPLPPGAFIVGRQIESISGEERKVTD